MTPSSVAAPARPAVAAIRRATPADLDELRELLRSRPMAGAVRLAFVPGADALGEVGAARRHTLVLHSPGDDRLVGTGSRTVHELWLGGRRTRVGFLTRLRLAPGACTLGRLRAGYAWIDGTRRDDEATFDLTTIVTDNSPARRLLERGLRGLPSYVEIARLVTLVASTRARGRSGARRAIRPATESDRDAIVAFLEQELRQRPLAPAWRRDDFGGGGAAPSLDEMRIVEEAGRIVAVGAVRDRRHDEELVVAGYAPWLALARPLVNLGRAAAGRPILPAPGSTLAIGPIAALAVRGNDPRLACELADSLRELGRARGLDLIALSIASRHPLLEPLRRRLAARSYASILYAVTRQREGAWSEAGSAAPEIESSWL